MALHVSAKQIFGAVAHWAVRQSPYTVPDNLAEVLSALYRTFDDEFDQFDFTSFDGWPEIESFIAKRLRSIPEYLAWNDRKNGDQSPFNFVSRYDGPRDPDGDFIDLHALERNVAFQLAKEASSE